MASRKEKIEIGIIGGSGLYEMEGLSGIRKISVRTPFGQPSGPYITGLLEGRKVAFLSRHGQGHRFLPSEINYRANIWGMKSLGVERIISVSAVGSMKEEIHPGHLVIPDQFFDHTRKRENTFFGGGIVAHVPFSHPICADLSSALLKAGRGSGAVIHQGGVYLCMEGPQFSSRAESLLYRTWGISVIGMTNATEAKLAREAEICYATIALATDYDCWHEEEAPVSVESVIRILHQNVELSKRLIRAAVPNLELSRKCACASALKDAVITARKGIPARTRQKLKLIVGKYL